MKIQKGWNILHQACSNGTKELLDWLLQWFHDKVPEMESRQEHFNKKSEVILNLPLATNELELVSSIHIVRLYTTAVGLSVPQTGVSGAFD